MFQLRSPDLAPSESDRKICDGVIWLKMCETKVVESSVSAGRRRRGWSESLVGIDGAASREAMATNAMRCKEIEDLRTSF